MAARRGKAPGVRGSRSGRPVMALLDLLGRRWALRILWELREGPEGFRALRARFDDVAPSVLNVLLRELEAAGILVRREEGWALSAEGAELGTILSALSGWAAPRGTALRRALAGPAKPERGTRRQGS